MPAPAMHRRHNRAWGLAVLLWLLAGAALAIGPVPNGKVPQVVMQSVRAGWGLIQAGEREGAVVQLQQAVRLLEQHPQLYPPQVRQAFTASVREFAAAAEQAPHAPPATHRLLNSLAPLDPLGAKARAPLGRAFIDVDRALARLNVSAADRLVQLTTQTTGAPPQATYAAADVARFAAEMRQGVNEPEVTFLLERLRNPAAAAEIAAWTATPKSKRVFVIGAGVDEAYVEALRKQYADEGYKLFFYRSCAGVATLCSERAVGAFFGTAEHHITIASDHTARSAYSQVELGFLRERSLQGPRVIIGSTQPFVAAIRAMQAPAQPGQAALRTLVTAPAVVLGLQADRDQRITLGRARPVARKAGDIDWAEVLRLKTPP